MASLAAATAGVVTLVFARTVVVPPRKRPENVRILSVDDQAGTITLASSPETRLSGDYGLWFSGDLGHVRLGAIVSSTQLSVTRGIHDVDFGDLATATTGRWSGWYYIDPRQLGLPFQNVEIPTELGVAPAWLVPSRPPTDRWVIQVHGRAVQRQETLRALPVFHTAGYTSLVISYRNDGDAPKSIDGRYGLGDTEWKDVDSAMQYAVDHGAREIVLMGWSMGGATVLQALTRSGIAPLVTGVALDSPVVDWVTALRYQGSLHRLPGPVRDAVIGVLGRKWSRRLTGLYEPIDLPRLDFVQRANELMVPILLMHSDDDGFVPASASTALAEARPDIVTYDRWQHAAHVKLWNYDRARWNESVRSWLASLSDAPAIGRTGNGRRQRAAVPVADPGE
ncbi:MAG: alpha/beta fold hydrolase [Microbacteriaceae bacterium]|nr:alpha/beta fold hydrolase [Microbacteriaceae bacterium]